MIKSEQTGCNSDRERTVVDLFACEEDVDRMKTWDKRRVLDVPQIWRLLRNNRSDGVFRSLRIDNADIHDPSATACVGQLVTVSYIETVLCHLMLHDLLCLCLTCLSLTTMSKVI